MANVTSSNSPSISVALTNNETGDLAGLRTLKITLIKSLEEWVRLIDMSIVLFRYQKMIRPIETIDIDRYIEEISQRTCVRLDAIHMRLKRRSEHEITTHSTLFLLCDILISKKSFILLDRKISDRIINIIKDLIHSPCFDGNSIEKLESMVLSIFDTKVEPENLFKIWSKSGYNSSLKRFKSHEFSQSENDITCRIYFDTIRLSLLKNVENNIKFIPSIVELGNFNCRCFNDFLIRFQISCAGPYKTQFKPSIFSNCGVLYFVKCTHEYDHVFNCNNSLSGIFQFSKKSITLRADLADAYIKKLPLLPAWIHKLSP